jgi:hypothetical protein
MFEGGEFPAMCSVQGLRDIFRVGIGRKKLIEDQTDIGAEVELDIDRALR